MSYYGWKHSKVKAALRLILLVSLNVAVVFLFQYVLQNKWLPWLDEYVYELGNTYKHDFLERLFMRAVIVVAYAYPFALVIAFFCIDHKMKLGLPEILGREILCGYGKLRLLYIVISFSLTAWFTYDLANFMQRESFDYKTLRFYMAHCLPLLIILFAGFRMLRTSRLSRYIKEGKIKYKRVQVFPDFPDYSRQHFLLKGPAKIILFMIIYLAIAAALYFEPVYVPIIANNILWNNIDASTAVIIIVNFVLCIIPLVLYIIYLKKSFFFFSSVVYSLSGEGQGIFQTGVFFGIVMLFVSYFLTDSFITNISAPVQDIDFSDPKTVTVFGQLLAILPTFFIGTYRSIEKIFDAFETISERCPYCGKYLHIHSVQTSDEVTGRTAEVRSESTVKEGSIHTKWPHQSISLSAEDVRWGRNFSSDDLKDADYVSHGYVTDEVRGDVTYQNTDHVSVYKTHHIKEKQYCRYCERYLGDNEFDRQEFIGSYNKDRGTETKETTYNIY